MKPTTDLLHVMQKTPAEKNHTARLKPTQRDSMAAVAATNGDLEDFMRDDVSISRISSPILGVEWNAQQAMPHKPQKLSLRRAIGCGIYRGSLFLNAALELIADPTFPATRP